jgi:protein-S-isoprenylcysteine O-methyltransferase Ste14
MKTEHTRSSVPSVEVEMAHRTQAAVAAAVAVYMGAFVAAMVVVKRSTGANPRGHARGHLLAALLNVLATFLLLMRSIAHILPIHSVDWFGRMALLDQPLARGAGAVSLVLAGVCPVWGEVSLGRSFRVALPECVQPLVAYGIYRFARNPLALSVDLMVLGVLLLAPSWLALISLITNIVAYEFKIRIEEAYLREAHGAVYATYCQRIGRYLPRLLRHRRMIGQEH